MKCQNCGQDNLAEARFCSNCGAALVAAVEPASPPVSAPPPVKATEYSGFWIRFAAFFIDLLISNAIRAIIAVPLLISILRNDWSSQSSSGRAIAIILGIIANLVVPVYFWLFTGLKGQTLGKMAVGIKVIDEQGNKPDLGQAALREIVGKFVSSIAFYIGFIWIAFDKEKQGWHDKIASTFVIKSRQGE